jgi:hypothetical protein
MARSSGRGSAWLRATVTNININTVENKAIRVVECNHGGNRSFISSPSFRPLHFVIPGPSSVMVRQCSQAKIDQATAPRDAQIVVRQTRAGQ